MLIWNRAQWFCRLHERGLIGWSCETSSSEGALSWIGSHDFQTIIGHRYSPDGQNEDTGGLRIDGKPITRAKFPSAFERLEAYNGVALPYEVFDPLWKPPVFKRNG
jgi:hypothetical protein